MAAGNWIAYNSFRQTMGDGTMDLDSDTFKIALFQNSGNAADAAQTIYGDLTDEVANGNGYTTGGAALSSVTFTYSGTTATFDCANPVFTASGGSISSIRIAVIYDDTAASDDLVCYCVLDSSDITVTSGNALTININPSGVFTISGMDS